MKIVIISRNCIPFSCPRSNRASELAKELVRQGHSVKLYALLGEYDYAELRKETGIEFVNLGNSRCGMVDNLGKSKKNLINRFVYHFFNRYTLYPDIELIKMVKKIIKKEGPIDLLITIAAPHMIHYAVAKSDLSKVGRWIADCGDPFMLNPFDNHPKYMERFERAWCKKCDYITVPIETAKNAYYPEYTSKIRVIPQGFDFSNVILGDYVRNEKPVFIYSGIFYGDLRDPSAFLKYLTTLDIDFCFKVFTRTPSFLTPYKEVLGDKLEINGYVSRTELLKILSTSDFLLNISNGSSVQRPSKLIDYAISKRPILTISSAFNDEDRNNFNMFFSGNYDKQDVVADIECYNIVNVAKAFLELA